MADPKLNVPKVGHLFARIEGLYNFVVVASGSIQAILKLNRRAAADFLPGAMNGSSLFRAAGGRSISAEDREKFLAELESQHSLHVTAVVLMFSSHE